MVIKLGAYDFLNWDYIKGVLAKFGFNNHWIKLINGVHQFNFFFYPY